MSRIKQLRNETGYNLSDFFENFLTKTKYVDLAIKLFKNQVSDFHDKSYHEIFNKHPDLFKDKSIIEKFFSLSVLFSLYKWNGVEVLKRFQELNERKLITKNDLSTYTNYDELVSQINIAETKLIEKELEGERIIVYDDNEWLLIKPLTYAANLKYGSNTKWCTTYHNQPSYFHERIIDGILIYCINKINGKKIAIYKDIEKHYELQFWNELDNRLDSMQTPFNNEVFTFIREHCVGFPTFTNYELMTDIQVLNELDYVKSNNLYSNPLMVKLGLVDENEITSTNDFGEYDLMGNQMDNIQIGHIPMANTPITVNWTNGFSNTTVITQEEPLF